MSVRAMRRVIARAPLASSASVPATSARTRSRNARISSSAGQSSARSGTSECGYASRISSLQTEEEETHMALRGIIHMRVDPALKDILKVLRLRMRLPKQA